MAEASFSRIIHSAITHIVQGWFEKHDEEFKVLPWLPDSPDLDSIEHLWDVLDQQVQFMAAPPQGTFRGLVESMPWWVNAILAARGGRCWFICVKSDL